ncbi:MAG: ribbon-helix-helix protein, CopG family [Verrucomicrobiales bacterium]
MKTITIHVSEPVYRDFQRHARRTDRKAAELIREAMAEYCERRIRGQARPSLYAPPKATSLGRILKPWTSRAELLEDFLSPRE